MSDLAVEGGEPVEEQVAPEGEATEVTEETTAAPEAAEAPSFDPLELQAELEFTRNQNDELTNLLQQFVQQQQGGALAQAAAPPQSQLDVNSLVDEYGNFNPQAYAQYQQQQNQELLSQIGQMFQPIQQTFQSQQEQAAIAEGEQRLQDIMADDISRNGEFAADAEADAQARDMVTTLASNMFPDIAQRYGATPQAAEIAMSRAAAQVRGLLSSVGGAAVTQNQNQLATLAGAHGEPGAGGAGVEAPVIRMGEKSAARFASGNTAA